MDETIVEKKRIKLQSKLEELLGSRNVYFNAKNGMSYPCIRYNVSNMDMRLADNIIYKFKTCYTITIIEHDVTSDLYLRIMDTFKYCYFAQKYDADGLHHTVLTLYY